MRAVNRLQANLCLLCVTLCWSAEVVIYACIPNGVPAFATTSVTAFASNVLGPLFLWWFWTRVSRTPFSLRTPRDLLRQCLLLVAMGVLEAAIVVPSVALVYPEVDARFLAWAVFGNTTVFPIIFGIPLSILLQEEFGFSPAGGRRTAPREDPPL